MEGVYSIARDVFIKINKNQQEFKRNLQGHQQK